MQSCSVEAEKELFPLSWLTQYGYCPRRCGLLALEQLWTESADTAAGRAQHERVHTARIERRNGQMNLYELPVFSRSLGVNGKCDCVEAVEALDGIALPYGAGRYRLYPVEYKHGVVRDEEEYHIQLCAQAMCLEEQFGCVISTGAIFYINAHRRDEITLTAALREKTRQTAEAVAEMLFNQQVPEPHYSAKCKKCSMREECQPKLKRSAASYCNTLWETAQEDVL